MQAISAAAHFYIVRKRKFVGIAAAEYEAASRKNTTVGIVGEIAGHDSGAARIVATFERTGRERDIFAFAA